MEILAAEQSAKIFDTGSALQAMAKTKYCLLYARPLIKPSKIIRDEYLLLLDMMIGTHRNNP